MRLRLVALLFAFSLPFAAQADHPAAMKQLMSLDPVALAKKYQSLPEPTEAQIPSGFALAEHIVPIYQSAGAPPAPALESTAHLPTLLHFAAFKLLKGKIFDAKAKMLKD